MTWSYDVGSLTAGSKDHVRKLVGDTDTNLQLISDEEITFNLTQFSNVYRAAAQTAEDIAATFAQQCDTTNTGDLSVKASQRFQHYTKLAQTLRTRAARGVATMKVYGSQTANVDTLDTDDSLVQPKFKLGMHNRGVQTSDDGADY